MTDSVAQVRPVLAEAVSACLAGQPSVIGLGIDAVDLDRMAVVIGRSPGFVRRVFSESERAYAERRTNPTERYAARFVAKEATLKAMGVGLWTCSLRDIEVVRAESGEPALELRGRAAELAMERGVQRWLLTITHTARMAMAVVVAVGVEDRSALVAPASERAWP